jgi:glucose-6-phosphate 1-dehydrogenase
LLSKSAIALAILPLALFGTHGFSKSVPQAVKQTTGDEVNAYERLLTDATHGDQLLFVREDVVEAAWAIVEPILDDVTPVYEY